MERFWEELRKGKDYDQNIWYENNFDKKRGGGD